jgi:FkbM family methyltransferase
VRLISQVLRDKLLARVFRGIWNRFQRVPLNLCNEDLPHAKISFSQYGEDLLIADHVFHRNDGKRGIYIDAGCFDPVRFSNTRLLNLRGWRGINIDAAPDAIRKFQIHRPDDQNVCAALSDREHEAVLVGREGAASRSLVSSGPGIPVHTTTLATIMATSPFSGEPVDFLDIDCECHDMEVLRGFPFETTRPLLVAIEAHFHSEARSLDAELETLGYLRAGIRGPTRIYRDRSTIPEGLPEFIRFSEL